MDPPPPYAGDTIVRISMSRLGTSLARWHPTNLPATYELQPETALTVMLVALGLIVGGAPWPDTTAMPVWGLPVRLAVAGSLILWGIGRGLDRRQVTISRQGVTVRRRGWLGWRQWHEPLSNYAGILAETMVVPRKKRYYPKQGDMLFEQVSLHHRERRRRVVLWWDRAAGRHRAVQERWARLLQVPALERDVHGELVARPPGELNLTVREAVAQGRVALSFDPRQAPPAPLQAEQVGEHWEIVCRGGCVTPLQYLRPAAWALPGVALLALAATHGGGMVRCTIAGLLWLAGVAVAETVRRATRHRLTLRADGLDARRVLGGRELQRCYLAGGPVESVWVGRSQIGQRPCLVVAGDHGRLEWGEGRPLRVLEWARECVLWHLARMGEPARSAADKPGGGL